jgi:hypothetical protein
MIPAFEDKAELFKWLHANKSMLIAQKKSVTKHADAVTYVPETIFEDKDMVSLKAFDNLIPPDATQLKIRAIINTTKLFDSHSDVHIDGLWNKSIRENTSGNFLVNQHNFTFEGVLSDNVKVSAMQMSWAELGFSYPGFTQALVYDAIFDKSDNPLMFEKYRTGKVKQHSVGMQYIKLDMAINDEKYHTEKGIWDKYIDVVVNQQEAIDQGYFWAVTEAKNHEGSAVLRGANFATPTQSIQQIKIEPVKATQQPEPVKATPFDISKMLNHYSNTLTNG